MPPHTHVISLALSVSSIIRKEHVITFPVKFSGAEAHFLRVSRISVHTDRPKIGVFLLPHRQAVQTQTVKRSDPYVFCFCPFVKDAGRMHVGFLSFVPKDPALVEAGI